MSSTQKETCWWCVICEEVVIASSNQAWCNRTSDCDGVTMMDIGYIVNNKIVSTDIRMPKQVNL